MCCRYVFIHSFTHSGWLGVKKKSYLQFIYLFNHILCDLHSTWSTALARKSRPSPTQMQPAASPPACPWAEGLPRPSTRPGAHPWTWAWAPAWACPPAWGTTPAWPSPPRQPRHPRRLPPPRLPSPLHHLHPPLPPPARPLARPVEEAEALLFLRWENLGLFCWWGGGGGIESPGI